MRQAPQINTGSMADIAFLLLVFFLVTTNIDQDYCIKSNISKAFEVPDSVTLSTSTLLVNNEKNYLLNDQSTNENSLCADLAASFDSRRFVKNVVLVKSDREVEFESFITALNESKKAIKKFHNDIANQEHGEEYFQLTDTIKAQIKSMHPVVIAEDVLED